MHAKTICAMVLFALLGLSFSATVGVGDTILVSNSDLGSGGAAPANGSAPAADSEAGRGESGPGASPANSGSAIVSVGETLDSSGNAGNDAPSRGNATPQDDTGRDSTPPSPLEPQQGMGRGQFMLTTASGQQIASEAEISAVQAAPGRIEVMEREGNAFVSAEEGGEGASEIDAEVSSAAGEQLRLRIQAMEREMLMQMGNVSVSTTETLRIRERLMYIERNGTEYRVNILPSDLPEPNTPDSSLENISLELSGERPAYGFTLRERRNFLGLFAVDSESRLMLDAQDARILSEEGPWWGFIAPPAEDLRPALNELSLRIASGQN
jgi:hypothetical protein